MLYVTIHRKGEMIDPKNLTSNEALQAAKDAVLLVRSGTATKEQLSDVIVELSTIIVSAVDVIEHQCETLDLLTEDEEECDFVLNRSLN